jgi:hypothetical protein
MDILNASSLTLIALWLLGGAGGIVIFVKLVDLVKWLQARVKQPGADGKPGNLDIPPVHVILSALKDYGYSWIFAAENMAVYALEDLNWRLVGADRKKIADDSYAKFPELIKIGDFELPVQVVKTFITKEIWSAFIQNLFDSLARTVKDQEAYLRKEVLKYAPDVDLDGKPLPGSAYKKALPAETSAVGASG